MQFQTERQSESAQDYGDEDYILPPADVANDLRIYGLLVQFDPDISYGSYSVIATIDEDINFDVNWCRR